LQLAVENRPVLAVLMRERQAAQQSSSAALRIALEADAGARQLKLRILKRRGALIIRPVIVEPPSPLPALPAFHEEPVPHAVDRPVPAATAA
jgi:hypothetical protein